MHSKQYALSGNTYGNYKANVRNIDHNYILITRPNNRYRYKVGPCNLFTVMISGVCFRNSQMASQVKQAFDTSILGGPVYRLEIATESELQDIRDLVPDDAILVSVRLPEAWSPPAKDSGFREIETLVQLERYFIEEDLQPTSPNIRYSDPSDREFCAAIAEAVFRSDRYHADPMVSEKIANRVKAAWARNEVNGRTDKTFIWEEDGEIAGFNGCLLQNRMVTIDLIAVSQAHQGRGIGAALIKAAFSHYARLADCALIATQDSNTGALALYRKLGFVETARFRTLHYVPKPIGF